jgi:serine/threonine protein kinase
MLGTERYMPPEILAELPYFGPSVDLFSAAIILFIMFTQDLPFYRADKTDLCYRPLCVNREDIFWKAHSTNKPNGADFFSEEFKNLITGLFQFEPAMRPQMADVLNHPWVIKDDCATLTEIQTDFSNRIKLIDKEREAKRQKMLALAKI